MTTGHSQEPSGPHYSTLPVDKEARLPPGTVVAGGRVEIVEELARGGMAIVYRARDLGSGGREVAFKVVTAQSYAPDTEARYRNEARLGASLAGHPQVVRPLGVGSLDGPPGFEGRMFLMTELIAGESLADVMFGFPTGMPIERASAIACDIARALVGLHDRGIVHRDIKPGNVLITEDGGRERARLIDFGLAYATGDGWEPKSPDLTQEGHAPGTPIYMSPQQAVHERPTPAFDIYSFGVMLYELISGNPPHEGVPLEVLVARKCDPLCVPFPIGKMVPGTPTKLAELVDQCLSYDPAGRPTAAEIVALLDSSTRGRAAPDLRVLPPPSVVAEGARPAGDLTRADLQRRDVQLPFVKRAQEEAKAAEQAAASVAHVPEPSVPVAVVEQAVSRAATPVVAVAAPPEPVVEPAPEPKRRAWWVLVVLLLFVGAVVVGLRVLGGAGEDTSPDQPVAAAAVEAEVRAPSEEVGPPEDEDGSPAPEIEPAPPTDPVVAAPDSPAGPAPVEPQAETPEPEPVPAKPVVEPPTPPRPEPAAPKTPKPTPPTCDERRALAKDAQASSKWSAVLAQTKDASCWSAAKAERDKLRVEALLRLGRHKACSKLAFSSKDPDVMRWGEECYRKAEEEAGSGNNE